jgi:hypothetical protein
MIHRPKTVIGYVFLFLIALGISPIVVSLATSPWGVMVWAALGVVALACLVLFLWRRRVEAARERAWVGSFSFADAVTAMHARETQQASHELRLSR